MPDILHRFQVNAPPHRVFEAFTSSEGLNSWWTLRCNGQPGLGKVYNFYFSQEHDWLAEVVHEIPERELTWKMTRAMDDWMGTEVGFTLSPVDEGTSVLFFHKGWKEPSDHFAITTYCWGQLLAGLKQYAEKGIIIPFEKRN